MVVMWQIFYHTKYSMTWQRIKLYIYIYSMTWHGICSKIHVLFTWTSSPTHAYPLTLLPYQVPPPPAISKGAHLPTVAPSLAHVLKQCMPIMYGLPTSAVTRNETATWLQKLEAWVHKWAKKKLMILRLMNNCLEDWNFMR